MNKSTTGWQWTPNYEVTKERCHDGVNNWQWTLWINDYAWNSYPTETEAWLTAERLERECEDAKEIA